MLLALAGFAYADSVGIMATGSYNFTIYPPMAGSAKASGAVTATGGMSPWVNPSIYSTPTIYWIETSTGAIGTGVATNLITRSTPGSASFTYKTGYGGSGQSYRLVGGGAADPYTTFTVYGTWSPD